MLITHNDADGVAGLRVEHDRTLTVPGFPQEALLAWRAVLAGRPEPALSSYAAFGALRVAMFLQKGVVECACALCKLAPPEVNFGQDEDAAFAAFMYMDAPMVADARAEVFKHCADPFANVSVPAQAWRRGWSQPYMLAPAMLARLTEDYGVSESAVLQRLARVRPACLEVSGDVDPGVVMRALARHQYREVHVRRARPSVGSRHWPAAQTHVTCPRSACCCMLGPAWKRIASA